MSDIKREDIVKAALGTFVGAGINIIVRQAVHGHVVCDTKLQQAFVFCGRIGIAMVFRDAAQKSIDSRVDETVELIESLTNPEESED